MGAARKILGALTLLLAGTLAGAEEPRSVGRVRVTRVRESEAARVGALEKALATGSRRLVSLRPRENDPTRYDATIYDYAVESAYEVVVDANGVELSKHVAVEEPPLAAGELDDAMAIVRAASPWSEGIAKGTHRVYAPMPPITPGKDGRRLVNVGVMRPSGFGEAAEHEIVSVHIPSGTIVRYPERAPLTGLATSQVCGPPELPCGAAVGACGSVEHYEWPAPNPVWKFDVVHPKCTQSVQPSGTGLEIRDVFYRDHLVLARAGVPVLNVRYEGNTCGPYRDWLYVENCFEATGTEVSPGILVTDGTPPTTFCESGDDQGVFKGVAVHDDGSNLWLVTETDAGHYRYIMEWRLYMDGRIQPIFGFGAASDSCTCFLHYHHAYWRFEWALDGTPGNLATGINTLERRVAGTTPAQWTPVPREALFSRPTTSWSADWFRVRNPVTGAEYVLKPGVEDGSAIGDDYARGDLWALAYNANEIDDPNTSTTIRIDNWLTNEQLGAQKRLVLWYRAGFTHDGDHPGNEVCHYVGPMLEPPQICPAGVTLDRTSYGCGDAVGVTVEDADLVGAGSLGVSARSTTETVPETLVLTESPPQSGRFAGQVATTSGTPGSGDGQVSVADADTLTVTYVDAASCGSSNVTVERTASFDCAPPAISAVAASSITETTAVLGWTTSEPANSSVAYGSTAPPATTQDDLAVYTTSHSVPLTGLAPCTTYLYSVSSADRIGNRATDTNGGGYHAFTTAGRGYAQGPDDVESGGSSWQASGPASTAWHVDTCKSASATHAFKAGSTTCPGFYGNGADSYLTSQVLQLGQAGHGYHLRYREFYRTEANHDLCRPQISVDSGATWTTLATYSGASGTWLARDIDLAAFSGSSVKLRFWLHTDLSGTDEGWYVDDIDVSRSAPCAAVLSSVSHALQDSCAGGGAPNGFLDAGERGVLQITARNAGLASATGVSATLASSSPGVTILDPVAALPDIPAGALATTLSPHLTFVVDSSVACGSSVHFSVHFAADQGGWDDGFDVPVGGTGATATTTWSASDVPRPIPDFPAPAALSTIQVGDPGTITDLDVGLSLQHTYDGDVDIFLIGPNGTRVELSTDNGNGGDNYTGTLFNDEATQSIVGASAPFSGSFKPEGALSTLDGAAAAGSFTLEVSDDGSSDSGTLQSWFLRLTSRAPSCTPCAVAAPSQEVGDLLWPTPRDLTWNTVFGADWYDVHEGMSSDLAALLTTEVDSCLRARTTAASLSDLDQAPVSGSFLWYLVSGANGGGIGPAGSATSGPRLLDDGGACP